jgi:integrase
MPKLTKLVVDAATPRDKQFTIWCSDLKGFGVFVHPSGTRTYFVDYRNTQNARRRMTIGRHGTITAEQARKLAIATLGDALKGEDPAEERITRRRSITVRELCEKYLFDAEKGLILGKGNRPKKSSTLYTDRGRIDRHIVPLIGSKLVIDLSKADINRFLRDVACGKTAKVEKTTKLRGKSVVRGGTGTAARTTGLLGGILTYAVSDGIIDSNPVEGIKKPADNRRQRRLSPVEYGILGHALAAAQKNGETKQVVDGVWMLALSGCRLGEIVNLKWSDVDVAGSALRLSDSKEGASVRPAGHPLLEHIEKITKEDNSRMVLTQVRSGEVFGGMPKGWIRIAKRAGFSDVTLHTLRHSFASVAGDLGYTEPTIAAMLGHAAGSVTSRYIHHLDTVLIAAADKVAMTIFGMMTTNPQFAADTVKEPRDYDQTSVRIKVD